MYDRPNAAELLTIARASFLQELMPHLPESCRYTGLMLANALAIAAREIQTGSEAGRHELARLGAFYPEAAREVRDERELEARLLEVNRKLAGDLRAGRFQGAELQAVRGHLLAITRAKLAVSNPKYLKAQEGAA